MFPTSNLPGPIDIETYTPSASLDISYYLGPRFSWNVDCEYSLGAIRVLDHRSKVVMKHDLDLYTYISVDIL